MTGTERVVAVGYGSSSDEVADLTRRVIADNARVAFLSGMAEDERNATLEVAEVLMSWAMGRELHAEALERAKRLQLVQLLSAGVDHLDLGVIPESVVVASNVGAYAEPMAEHVMAMTLALAKRLPQRHAAMAQGRWEQHLLSLSLDGATCGIVGYGGIGKATARLMRAFGARIWALNTSGTTHDEVEFVGTLADLDRTLEVSDVVVLSLPLTRSTRGLIGAGELALMKPEAILVNVARGAVVDQRALYEHAKAHPDFGVGIDTWWTEPLHDGEFRTDFPFFDLPNVIGSPHNSSLVEGIYTTAASRAAQNVLRYLTGAPLSGVVRREDYVAV